ncbi:sugar O-acetyltransferase [Williamsia sp. M5A3_1d]
MGEQADRLSSGEWYLDDDDLREQRRRCAELLDEFHAARGSDDGSRDRVIRLLAGAVGAEVVIVPRFSCSYGSQITLGDNVFVNGHAFFMDDAPITLGANVRVGPGATLVTALHPVDDHARRRQGWERAAPIAIGENSWLAASVTVCPGVTIGRNAVIGAGSVVVSDIPDNAVAVGSPARVVRLTNPEGGLEQR